MSTTSLPVPDALMPVPAPALTTALAIRPAEIVAPIRVTKRRTKRRRTTRTVARSGAEVEKQREALAQRVADGVTAACAKLAEYRADIEALWQEFAALKPGETIMGCTSKTQFCDVVLNRSMRAVQYMLNGGNPDNQKQREIISRPKPAIKPKQQERLLKAATIVGTELIPAFEKGGDIEAPIRELKKISFDSAELNNILDSQIATPNDAATAIRAKYGDVDVAFFIEAKDEGEHFVSAQAEWGGFFRVCLMARSQSEGRPSEWLNTFANELRDNLKLLGLWNDKVVSAFERGRESASEEYCAAPISGGGEQIN